LFQIQPEYEIPLSLVPHSCTFFYCCNVVDKMDFPDVDSIALLISIFFSDYMWLKEYMFCVRACIFGTVCNIFWYFVWNYYLQIHPFHNLAFTKSDHIFQYIITVHCNICVLYLLVTVQLINSSCCYFLSVAEVGINTVTFLM